MRQVFEFQQQVDQGHGVNQSGRNQWSVHVDRHARLAKELLDVVHDVLLFCGHFRR